MAWSWTCGAPRCGPSGDVSGLLTARENPSSRVCLDITCSYYTAHRLLLVLLSGPSLKETPLFASLLSPLLLYCCLWTLCCSDSLEFRRTIIFDPPPLLISLIHEKEFKGNLGKKVEPEDQKCFLASLAISHKISALVLDRLFLYFVNIKDDTARITHRTMCPTSTQGKTCGASPL